MIVKSELSKKYAQAYFHLYSESIQQSSLQSLQDASHFLSHSKEILFLLGYGTLESQEVARCVQLFIQRFNLPHTIEKLCMLLLAHSRIFLLGFVLHDICCIYKEKNNEIDVTVSTAHELSHEQLELLKEFFTFYSKAHVFMNVQRDPSLIAGIRMESETWLWEDSVAKKLRALQQNVLL